MICKPFPTFIQLNTVQRHDMLKLINFIVFVCLFCKYTVTLNLMLATHSNTLALGRVYHCVTSPLLLTSVRQCYSFESENLSHCCLIFNFSCSTVRVVRCCISCFIIGIRCFRCCTFSKGGKSGLKVGQSSTHTLLL